MGIEGIETGWAALGAALLLLGLALGLVGASFSVGTPYVARFFPKERRGFAMGVRQTALPLGP